MNFHRSRREEDLDISINLISFIDVLLCLVIFFMVSTTFINTAAIKLTLPQASAEAQPEEEKNIEVVIDAQGACYIAGKGLPDNKVETIVQALSAAAEKLQNPAVIINADENTRHQSIIDVLDAARQAGLLRVSFATEKPAQ
jgi:biopolymer transport protein ExbD